MTEYKSKLREFKGYLHKVPYVLCNDQLENVQKLVMQTVQTLKSY